MYQPQDLCSLPLPMKPRFSAIVSRRKLCKRKRMPACAISTLPDDVIIHIFELGTFHSKKKYNDAFPVLVSRVCKHWRALALQTSTLWSTIVVDCKRVTHQALLRLPELFREIVTEDVPNSVFPRVASFLTRSRSVPLVIELDLTWPDWHTNFINSETFEDGHCFNTMHAKSLAYILLPHANRFKQFSLVSDTWSSIIWLLLEMRLMSMPKLEKMEIRRFNMHHCFKGQFIPRKLKYDYPLFPVFYNPDVIAPRGGDQFQNDLARSGVMYPRLKDITLSGTHMHWSNLACCCLHSLTISYLAADVRPSFTELRYILNSNAETLNALDIVGALPIEYNDETSADQDIALPCLNALTLGYVYPGEATRFISTLHVPNLKSLAFHDLARSLGQHGTRNFGDSSRHDATELIETISVHVPILLSKIERLSLHSVALAPVDEILHAPEINPYETDLANLELEPRLQTPLRLFLSMTSLKQLWLLHADPAFLLALNTPLPSPDDGPCQFFFVLPSLIHLSLDTAFSEVSHFFRTRTTFAQFPSPSPYNLPLFEKVNLDMTELHEARLWEADDVDFDDVTEEIEFGPSEEDYDTEPEDEIYRGRAESVEL